MTPLYRQAVLFVFVFILLIGFSFRLVAQEDCSNYTLSPLPDCACADCGDIEPIWEIVGSSVICEGEEFQLTPADSYPMEDIETYHWYFIESATLNTVDEELNLGPDNVDYIYVTTEQTDCGTDDILLKIILLITSPSCSDGESCRIKSTTVNVLLRPTAFFEPEQDVCVGDEVSFNNGSCHATNFYWDFGDGNNSDDENPDHTYDAPGTYTVTLTASNDNCNGVDTYSQTVTVVSYPEAAFSYDFDPENGCEPLTVNFNSTSNQWTNISWGIMPDDSLLWCLTDTNMHLYQDSIEVLFKEHGEYEVVLTASNICDEVTIDTLITVFQMPWINLNESIADCDAITISSDDLNFNFGGEITEICWSFEGAANNPATICDAEFYDITFTYSGTITLTASSPCWAEDEIRVINVTINLSGEVNLDMVPTEICPNNGMIDLTGDPGGGQWTSGDLPSGVLTINGAFDPTDVPPGTYELNYLIGGGTPCPSDQDITIEVLEPIAVILQSPEPSCDELTLSSDDLFPNLSGDIDSYTWSFSNAADINAANFNNINFTNTDEVSLTVNGYCGQASDTVSVVVVNTAFVTLDPMNPDTLCRNDAPVQLLVTPENGTWVNVDISAAGLTEDGLLTPAEIEAGTYQVSYTTNTDPNVDCGDEQTFSLIMLENVSVEIQAIEPACDNLELTPQVDFTGAIDSYAWVFPGGTPSSSSLSNPGQVSFTMPDTFYITLEVSGRCGTAIDSVLVEIQENTTLSIDPVNNPLCSGSSPDTLTANVPDGVWSGDGIVDADLGVFDPASVEPNEIYNITYALLEGACTATASIAVEVVQSATVDVENTLLCEDSAPVNLVANPVGGTWSGSVGIVDETTGLFDATLVGPDTISVDYFYVDANDCEIIQSADIWIEAFPVITIADTVILCVSDLDASISDVVNYSVSPTGGTSTWSGDGIVDGTLGTFNSLEGGLNATGFYTVYVTYSRNECTVLDSVTIELIENPILMITPDTSVCIDTEFLQLSANFDNGTWFGPGVDEAGLIDLVDAGMGTFQYEYIFAAGTNCEQSAQVNIQIIDLSSVVEAGEPFLIEICEGPMVYQMDGYSPQPGTWSGEGINSITGEIDIVDLNMDTVYTFTYCIESDIVANCPACDTREFIIHSNPVIQYETTGLPCIGEVFCIVDSSLNAATYLWEFCPVDIPDIDCVVFNEAEPCHTFDEQGNYNIMLTVTSSHGCTSVSNENFYITTPPHADFELLGEAEGCAPFEVIIDNMSYGDSITQWWCIGQDTILGPDPGVVFLDSITQDSVFNVLLKVENFCGLETDDVDILVHPYPLVNFGINWDEHCSPLEADFSNTTLGQPDSFVWLMSTGNTYFDTLPPQQTFYADSMIETYTATLFAFNECGSDSLTKEFTVLPPDVNAFIEQDTLSGCEPFSVQLYSYSTPGADVNWQVYDPAGNVQGSDLENPEFVLETPGMHTFVLHAFGCGIDFDTAQIEVFPAPEIDVTIPPFVCVNDSAFFQNTSLEISGSYWDFGDGNTDTLYAPFHSYTDIGLYNIVYTGYSNANDCPATTVGQIEVLPTPVATFSASQTMGCQPLQVFFENGSAEGLSSVWSIDSLNFYTHDLSHTFDEAGAYTVMLEVSDDYLCSSDTAIYNIFVYDLPESDFHFEDIQYCYGYDSLVLMNSSLDAVDYQWVFLNDTFLMANPPAILPDAIGIHEIQLVTFNEHGCTDTLVKMIEIEASPQAEIQEPILPFACPGSGVHFENNSLFSDGYLWEFNHHDDTATDIEPYYEFQDSGVYVVYLTSYNSNGCPESRDSLQMTIHPKPDAAFSYEKEADCGTPVNVSFYNNNFSDDNDWYIDGVNTFENVINPVHVFEEPGNYSVSLIVSNIHDCADTIEQVVHIYPQPIADIVASDYRGCDDLEVTFFNDTTGGLFHEMTITSMPGVFTEFPFNVTLEEPDSYTVKLLSYYNEICRDSTESTIIVYESPEANFSYEIDVDENITGDVQFYQECILFDSLFWDLGDGTITSEYDPFHEYDINRPIPVTLTAINENEGIYLCVDSITQLINPEWIQNFIAPNAFAPDYGTGDVRVFKPAGVGIRLYKIEVYAPSGDVLWYSTLLENGEPLEGWDGTTNGTPLSQGTFVWKAVVEFESGDAGTYRGTVTLLR